MSIKSTMTIPYQEAVDRIKLVASLIKEENYREIEKISFDPDLDVQQFVRDNLPIDVSNIENWTYEMIEDVLDEPFFRKSMFDNYLIGDDD